MKFSKKGYLRNSPDVNNSQNIIQGGKITMKGVDFKVKGVDNNGYSKIMTPGNNYTFPNAKYVIETPIKNKNMAPFKLRSGKGNMPKTGRSIPSPFQQNADEVSGDPVMVPVTGSSYRISPKALDQAWEQVQTMTAEGLSGTFMGDNAAVKPKFKVFTGNKLIDISTGSKAGINITGLGGEDTATTGFEPYTVDKDAFYKMMNETGTVTIMPTGDGTNMLPRSFQERPETDAEKRRRLFKESQEAAKQTRLQKQNGFTQAEDVPVDTTTGVNSTRLTREQILEQRRIKLEESKLKRQAQRQALEEKKERIVAERKRKLEELKRKRQQR